MGTLVLLLTANLGAQAPAQAPPVRTSQEVVVTASAVPTPAEWVGRALTILTAEDLGRLGVTWVADALRLVPGVDVRARGPREVQSDFSIRGATFGQNLVLIDGRRINDSQSGHHNGDVPVTIAEIDRIEVVPGPGSAVHGADALGGTINVITRRDARMNGQFAAGQFGYVSGHGTLQGGPLPDRVAISGWAARSSGFETGREFAQGGGSLRAALGQAWSIEARHVSKEFGAKNFYGPSTSKEWTDQTLVGVDWKRVAGEWTTAVRGFARNHGDHFRWDINRPGFAENLHRTNAVEADARIRRDFSAGTRVSLGAGGGGDWVRSSNLGDREYGRGHAFVEVQQPWTARALVTAGLRADHYSSFGGSVSPSVAGILQVKPQLRLRSSASRGFRVPTFTELYYHDPANLGTPTLEAEHGWSVDGGVDWTPGQWTASISPFIRWDVNVIDWVRAAPTDLWRSTNVRDVRTAGVEASVSRRWAGGQVRGFYSTLDVEAPSLNQLSKYVLEYARHSVGATLTSALGHGFRGAMTVDHRRRADGQTYTLLGLRASWAFKRTELFVDGTNLLDETYREIASVSMPGRWMTVGLRFTN